MVEITKRATATPTADSSIAGRTSPNVKKNTAKIANFR
jgi:hypothetical protein